MYPTQPVSHHCILSVFLCFGVFVYSLPALAEEELRDAVPAVTKEDAAADKVPATETSESATTAIPDVQIFAMVNDKPITVQEFNIRYASTMRDRFYHGKAPEDQAEAVRKEVADFLIEDMLLFEEAVRRGFKPDEAKLEQIAAGMEARYGTLPEWRRDREQALATMKKQVGRQSMIEQVKKVLRDVQSPTPAEVRAYYEQKPELFTEPEKLRLSIILLGVDPGAPRADWDKAREEAQGIYLRLKDGADFAESARQYSTDSSAGNGGDLGFVHGGQLPERLQGLIGKLQVGEVMEPFTGLQGIALYRLDERVAPTPREFAEVEQRAQRLLKRDREEQAWKEALTRLRENAKIEILVPIANDSGKQSDNGK